VFDESKYLLPLGLGVAGGEAVLEALIGVGVGGLDAGYQVPDRDNDGLGQFHQDMIVLSETYRDIGVAENGLSLREPHHWVRGPELWEFISNSGYLLSTAERFGPPGALGGDGFRDDLLDLLSIHGGVLER